MIHADTIQLIRRLKLKPKQGVLGDVLKEMAKVATAWPDSVTALIQANMQLGQGIDKLTAANETLAGKYTKLTEKSLYLENQNTKLNKSFGIGIVQAAALSQEIAKVAKNYGISTDNMKTYAGNIKRILPTLDQSKINKKNTDYYDGLIAVQKVLTTNLGLSAEQADEYSFYSAQQGESAANTLESTQAIAHALDPAGNMGYLKIITAGIAKAGSTIQLQYGKVAGSLELAVIKAHSLGLEVVHLQTMGSKLLDIESSIGDELEYQLLSGHRLVGNATAIDKLQGKSLTNAYRTATISDNMNDQAEIMGTILDQEGATLSKNLFARQQMAKLMGIEESSLSRALQTKEMLEKSGAQVLLGLDTTEMLREADEMVKKGTLSKDDFDKLLQINDTRSTEEIAKEQLEVSQEILIATILQTRQLDIIKSNSADVKKGAKDIKLANLNETQLQEVGADMIALQKLSAAYSSKKIASEMISAEHAPQAEIKTQDALLVNDGLVNFNPRDQFMQVNDSTMIAGTNVDGNKKVARELHGQGSKMTSGQVSQLVQSIEAMGALMAAAVNTQTKEITRPGVFGPGINGPTWS